MATSWTSLRFFLLDALSAYSEDFQLLSTTNPVRLSLNGQLYSVHISSIHDSGNTRVNDDEQRIQPQRAVLDLQAARRDEGDIPLFIGFFPDGSVFTAWDPRHVFSQNPEKGGSVYARLSHFDATTNDGAALRIAHLRKIKMAAAIISLRAEALGFYFENWQTLHAARTDAELRHVIDAMGAEIESGYKGGEAEVEVEVGGNRETVTTTRTSFVRDPKFVRDIMEAYEGKCCVCDRQLGLVEAAHIVPHGHPNGTDDVTNGLALCVEHHKLYDSRLLLPTSGRQLYLNPDRVEHLRNIGQASGLNEIEALAAGQYKVPHHVPSRPNDAFLERGVRIRLGTDA